MQNSISTGTCNINQLHLELDNRLGGVPRQVLVHSEEELMQVPDEIRKCVMFICYESKDGLRNAGTAFLISVPITDERIAVYIVTAKHVIEGVRKFSIDQNVRLRYNTKKTKGVAYITSKFSQWILHPSDDVAILNWTPPQDIVDYRTIPIKMIASQEVIKQQKIGVGEEVFLTGLFASHYGTDRNIPIMRVGNIAAMPEEKVYVKDFGQIDAYLVEVRSIGGLSGSPVFVYLGSWRIENGTMKLGGKRETFYWLGIIHGHYDQDLLDMDGLTPDALRNLKINMGIAIVTPSTKVLDIINREDLVKEREELKKRIEEEKAPTPDIKKEDK
jgi:hypothetical protein